MEMAEAVVKPRPPQLFLPGHTPSQLTLSWGLSLSFLFSSCSLVFSLACSS